CARKTRLLDGGMTHMAVEIAIRAFRQTERPMDVDAKSGASRSASCKTSLREFQERARSMREPFACWRQAMFLNVRHLAKGKHVAIRQKHWIIAETPRTAWRPDEGTVHRGVELFHMPIGPGEAECADELRLTLLGRLRAALAQFIFHRLH